jgi:hypothetical protein
MRAIPEEFRAAPGAARRPQGRLRRNKTTVIYRNFLTSDGHGLTRVQNPQPAMPGKMACGAQRA